MNWQFWVGTPKDTTFVSGKALLGIARLDDSGLNLYLKGLQLAQREDFRSRGSHEVFAAPVYEDGRVDFRARLPASKLVGAMLGHIAAKEAANGGPVRRDSDCRIRR